MNLDEEFSNVWSDIYEQLNGTTRDEDWDFAFERLKIFEDKLSDDRWNLILNYFLAKYYFGKKDFENAEKFILRYIGLMQNKVDLNSEEIQEFHRFYSMLGFAKSKNEDTEGAFEAFKKSIMTLGLKQQKIANDNYYYCYRKIDPFLLQNLSNRDITVASPSVFNDPVDCPFFPIMDARSDIFDTTAAKKAYGYFKVGCFVCNKNLSGRVKNENALPEYKNLLMWGHYANGHRGVCIKYKFNSEFLAPTQDCPTLILDVEYKDDYSLNNEKSKFRPQEFLATKNSCWSYENEVRLLHYDPNCNDNYKNLPLGDHSKVEAIYFGMKCTERDINCIKKILGEEVAYYKMKQHNNDFFQLIAEVDS